MVLGISTLRNKYSRITFLNLIMRRPPISVVYDDFVVFLVECPRDARPRCDISETECNLLDVSYLNLRPIKLET